MSPRFYTLLWMVFFVSAGLLLLGGVFTITTLIVYGFIAFGLVFTGMMCVLPNVAALPAEKGPKPKTRPMRPLKPAPVRSEPVRMIAGAPVRRHA